jgi:hypothetical protein
MNGVWMFVLTMGFLFLASEAGADTLILNNGDHLTGTITGSDGKQITFKTDYAGEIKVQWSALKELTSDKPLYIVTPEKKTLNGNVTTRRVRGKFTCR